MPPQQLACPCSGLTLRVQPCSSKSEHCLSKLWEMARQGLTLQTSLPEALILKERLLSWAPALGPCVSCAAATLTPLVSDSLGGFFKIQVIATHWVWFIRTDLLLFASIEKCSFVILFLLSGSQACKRRARVSRHSKEAHGYPRGEAKVVTQNTLLCPTQKQGPLVMTKEIDNREQNDNI